MKSNLASAIFAGHESLLIHCAEAWLDAGHAVRAVVSTEPTIVQWAHTRGVAAFADEASLVQQSAQAFDYLFCLGKPCSVSPELMARAQALAIAFHDAPLPQHAGWHAPAWALMAQETSHGVTWQEMTPLGEGRIVRQARFDIPPGETTLGLKARCHEAGLQSFKALTEAIDRNDLALGETLPAGPSVDRDQRPSTLGTLDFSCPASELAALVGALDFGPAAHFSNPLARAKLFLGDKTLLLDTARALPAAESSGAAAGTVLQASANSAQVATADGDIVLDGFTAPWGTTLGHGLVAGMALPLLDGGTRAELAARALEIGQGEGFWQQAMRTLAPVELPYPQKTGAGQFASMPLRQLARVPLALSARGAVTVAGFFGWLSALTAQQHISLLYGDSTLQASAQGLEYWLSPWVPLTLDTAPDQSAQQAAERAQAQIDQMHRAGACPRDLPMRLGSTPGAGEGWSKLGISLDGAVVPPGAELILMCDATGQQLELVGDTAVFSSETLETMASHLAVYLQAFEGADPIAAIALMPDTETASLARLNATATPYDAALGIHEAIAAQMGRTPHSTAVSFRGQTLSYHELHAQAGALAERLRLRGVRPGDVVGLCLERGPDLVIGVLAILQTGAAYLPLDPEYPHDRLLYMIEDSGAPLVLSNRAVTDRLHIPSEKVFLLDEAEAEAEAGAGSAPVLTRNLGPDKAQRAAYLIYTSGSTGRPKGVVVTHQNALNFFAGLNARIPHVPPGRWLAVTSVCFDISVVELLWTLTHGFAIELHTNALPYLSVADALRQGQVTHLQCTPSMASMLVSDTAGRQALSGLAVLMVGGEALSMKLARELRELVPGAFFNMYGPTETTVWSTACDLATLGDLVPLGQPIANTQLSIRTPRGAECPALVAGELLIGGDGVSDGYWQRPELNAERFLQENGTRWYRTGDLVRRHPDSTLEFLGRIDHQVKIRGHRIELGEIESVLLRQPGVKEAVVIAREDAAGDWSLAAYVTPQADALLDTDQLRLGVAEKLPDIMVPKAIAALRTFPLTPNGKVDRRALLPVRSIAADAGGLPQNPLEKAIASAWEQVLGQSGVRTGDSFFDLGGSLLLAVQVQRRLQETCGLSVPLADMMRFPILGELAVHLDASMPASIATAGLHQPTAASAALAPTPLDASPVVHAESARASIEFAIAQMWRELLGVQDIAPGDDFFALGGHSLTGVRLFAQIRKQFAVDLPLATLFQASTLAGFTAIVVKACELSVAQMQAASASGTATVPKWSPLVAICQGQAGHPPLFCVHAAGGNVINFKRLATELGPEQPFYGLQAQGVDGHRPALATIQAMAAQYVEAIRSVDPQGPYWLLGYSAGGVIALEMAHQLRQAGAEVALLGMIDTLSPEAAERHIPLFKKLWLMRHWSLKFIRERSERRRQARLLEENLALRLGDYSPGEPVTQDLIGHHLFHHFFVALKLYRPKPYPGPMVLFKGASHLAEMPYLNAGPSLGWEKHIQGGIRPVTVVSHHASMMEEPGVLQLAQALQRELARSGNAPATAQALAMPQTGPSLA